MSAHRFSKAAAARIAELGGSIVELPRKPVSAEPAAEASAAPAKKAPAKKAAAKKAPAKG